MELHDFLCDSHQLSHGTERTTAEVHVRACKNYPSALICQGAGDTYDAVVQKLDFVNRHDTHIGMKGNSLHDFPAVPYRDGLDLPSVVRGELLNPSVTVVEVRLENPDLAAGDRSAPHASE